MRRKEWLLQWTLVVTAALTMLIYAAAFHLGFLHYFDSQLLTSNTDVTHYNLFRILFHAHAGNYFPLSYLSYTIEQFLFGMTPFPFHFDNILLHVLNSLLAVLLLFRLSRGSFLIAAFGGILFAVHPLHVETVAWVSARPALLCAFFLLISSHCYIRYSDGVGGAEKNPFSLTHLLSLFFFVLALFSSPAALMFPFVLFFFDVQLGRSLDWKGTLEKIPFLAMGAVFVVFMLLIQKLPVLGAVKVAAIERNWSAIWWPVSEFPFSRAFADRLAFDLNSTIAGFTALLALIFVAAGSRKARVPLLFGTAFFVLLVIPDLRLPSFGDTRLFGENIYLASLGLFYALAFLFSGEFWESQKIKKLYRPLGIAAMLALVVFLGLTSRQNLKAWSDDAAVWNEVLRNSPQSPDALYNWGGKLCSEGQFDSAIKMLSHVQTLEARAWRSYTALGDCLRDKGDMPGAVAQYEKALLVSPENPDVLMKRGEIEGQTANLALGIQDLKHSIELDEDNGDAYFKLAALLERSGATTDAETALEAGLEIDPKSPEGHHRLGNIFLDKSQLDQAALHFRMALDVDDRLPKTHFSLANVYAALGLGDRAFDEYEKAIKMDPAFDSAYVNLGLLFLRTGKLHEAEAEYKKALEINPKLLAAHRGLAEAYEKDGKPQEAASEKMLGVPAVPNAM